MTKDRYFKGQHHQGTYCCFLSTAGQGEAGSDPNLYLACLDHELIKFPALPFMSSAFI